MVVLYGISELCGLREYTSFLSGTSANPDMSWETAAILGLIHLLLYVAFILLVPVSLIAAGLLMVWNRWTRRERTQPQTEVVMKGASQFQNSNYYSPL